MRVAAVNDFKRVARIEKCFCVSVAAILSLTATLKLIAMLEFNNLLGRPDPIFFFLSIGNLMVITSLLEWVVVLALVSRVSWNNKLLLVIWITTLFVTYRVGLLVLGYHGECNCLGQPASWMALFQLKFHANSVSQVMLGYMVTGCLLSLARIHKWKNPADDKR